MARAAGDLVRPGWLTLPLALFVIFGEVDERVHGLRAPVPDSAWLSLHVVAALKSLAATVALLHLGIGVTALVFSSVVYGVDLRVAGFAGVEFLLAFAADPAVLRLPCRLAVQ